VGALIVLFVTAALIAVGATVIFFVYRGTLREAKNYERGLKMVPILIHLPPASDDIAGENRDKRDLTEEVLSQAQVMYNIIASTATKGFKSRIIYRLKSWRATDLCIITLSYQRSLRALCARRWQRHIHQRDLKR